MASSTALLHLDSGRACLEDIVAPFIVDRCASDLQEECPGRPHHLLTLLTLWGEEPERSHMDPVPTGSDLADLVPSGTHQLPPGDGPIREQGDTGASCESCGTWLRIAFASRPVLPVGDG